MEIVHLQYFIAVARHRSFSRAAAASHVSQSVISKLVKDLEQELGVLLLNRNAKKVTLTEAGTIFLAEADKVVTLFNNLTSDFENRCKLPRGKIRIGLPLMTEAVLFAQLLGNFRKKYPEIETELYEFGSKKIELAIQEGLLDIGIICCLPGSPGLYDSFLFSHEPLKVVVHPGHALAKLKQVSLADLSQESFILSSQDFSLHDEIIKKCNQAGFQPKVALETSQRELMVQTVAVNLGIALIPQNICERLSTELVRTIPLVNPEIIHNMSVIWKKGRALSYPAKLFIEFVQAYLLSEQTQPPFEKPV
ncbi:LysR family transcriptional regulator [Sporomusa acidovorans]|uniref:HTH-type transcriptional regulator GltC n=1 Tax=Sporomusa acidovorans (strain ATCC 49682 / DSM 3132 / Mol) TaxID=1123286 RepID=A0ABZ3IVZ4_SPOA4|nr:LysR family transcriptional regulator [Sporomusa acidovorans]OZC13990.1 HTH-type transcriptional regulator GltC [Sporomusa acidovorans DSM 3132]SDF21905.1 DNA-binding transcriptional regulator, LysR family [Sporomusa acidovorans]